MARSRQMVWAVGLLESAPPLVFVTLWRGGVDVVQAGWIGCALAVLVLAGFRRAGQRYHPVLLGMNLHMLLLMPLIQGAFALGLERVGDLLVAPKEAGVFIAVLATGLVLTLASPRGFLDMEEATPRQRWIYSGILLAVTAAMIPWSLAHLGQQWLSIAAPLAVLFGLRSFLTARVEDRSKNPGPPEALAVAALPVAGGGPPDL